MCSAVVSRLARRTWRWLARQYSALVSWFAQRTRYLLRHQTTCNLLGTLSTAGNTARNPNQVNPLPSVDDIAAVAENSTMENAIIISQTEIEYLDKLSLEGDVPDNISE